VGRRSRAIEAEVPGFAETAEIGSGRLAAVYEAREIATDRLVALKMLSVPEASQAAVDSFGREAAALGAVGSHPHVLTLLRASKAADGRPVLVLELCRDLFAARPTPGPRMSVAEAVEVAGHIAEALDRVHAAGIVHCDVKPANILRTQYGRPVLADFGAAILPEPPHTQLGLVDLASPHVAPELLSGGTPSTATDVYAWASTLYELIAGRAAFGGTGTRSVPAMSRILDEPVPPLRNAAVPAGLFALIEAAMSKHPADRPSISDLGARLRALAL
jgi:non-specific serine/threonine protein kinase